MDGRYTNGGGVSVSTPGGYSGSTVKGLATGPAQGFVDDARDSLDKAVAELNSLVVDLRGFADNMLGEAPLTPALNNLETNRVSSSRAEQLRDRLAWLHSALGDLRQQVNRLSAI